MPQTGSTRPTRSRRSFWKTWGWCTELASTSVSASRWREATWQSTALAGHSLLAYTSPCAFVRGRTRRLRTSSRCSVLPSNARSPSTWSIVADIGSATSPPNARFLGVRISREDDRHRLTVGIARLTSRAPVGLAPQPLVVTTVSMQVPHFIERPASTNSNSDDSRSRSVQRNGRRSFGNQWLSSRRLDLSVALALGFAGNLPRSHGLVPDVLASVEPWASPRLHFRRISVDNNVLDTVWHRGAGLAAGLWIRFRWGMGIQAAYDWLYIPHPPSERCRWSRSWSVGGHYAFF